MDIFLYKKNKTASECDASTYKKGAIHKLLLYI